MGEAPIQLGRYPSPRTTIAHLSDTHLLAGGAPLGGLVDTVGALEQAVVQLSRLGTSIDAVVVTGDVADLGEPDAYRIARGLLEPLTRACGAELVWVMGNHDERGPFREQLLDETAGAGPVHRVARLGDLRVVAFDCTVPGWHHGAIDEAGAEWLAQVLAEPAPAGTVLAMHHAPIATPVALMDVLELQGQELLAEVVRGSDVRLILGGHLHYATSGVFAGVPVHVAGAAAYTIDVTAPPGELWGVDGGRALSIVQLFDDGHVVSVAPIEPAPVVSRFDLAYLESLAALAPAERLERFSRKPPGAA
ncbi:metallophosphoesterase [Agromyces soli]